MRYVVLSLLLVLSAGCSDPIFEDREQLAICLMKINEPVSIDYENLPPEMDRMHRGYERAKRTAMMLEEYVAAKRELDQQETLDLGDAYSKSEKQISLQFKAAIDDGRPGLEDDEHEVVAEYANVNFLLFG